MPPAGKTRDIAPGGNYGEAMLRRFIARTFWRLSRWNLSPWPAPERPTVFVGAPHTSNWDFVLMLATTWALGIDFRWLGKDSLFRGPIGVLTRATGGIPVNRDNPDGVVEAVVEQVRGGEVFGLVVAPDGTRGGNTHWKSGFYRIARAADLPVTLCFIDRTTMTAGLGPQYELTGDVHADMEHIREFYSDKAGFRPEKRGVPRLRHEPKGIDGAG